MNTIKAASPFGSNKWLDGDIEDPHRKLVRQTMWEIIKDPTGDFPLHRLFRFEDVESGCQAQCQCWEPGTRFKHIMSGKVLEVYCLRIISGRPILKLRQVKTSDQLELL